MSRRDEVWEIKRQRFLNRQKSGLGSYDTALRSRPPSISTSAFTSHPEQESLPTSPLSQLVQSGYPVTGQPTPPSRQDDISRSFGSACPPSLPSRSCAVRQNSFDSNVAQQWSNDVQSTLSQHQQKNDPNFAGRYTKTSGYRVTHAPGGGSSISLSDGSSDVGTFAYGNHRAPSPSRGIGAVGNTRAPSPLHANRRSASPSYAAGRSSTGFRESSPFGQRSASPFSNGVGSTNVRHAPSVAEARGSYEPRYSALAGSGVAGSLGGSDRYGTADLEPRSGMGSGANVGRPPVPLPRNDSRELGGGNGLAFAARVDARSSNAFACGSSQNTGNYICDRSTTRVSRPPGGASQISFG